MAALPKGSGPMAPNRPPGAHGLAPWVRLWIEGLKTALCFEGTLNAEVFLFFLHHFLLPLLRPGDIVLLDNAKAHHVEQVRELIEQAGAQVVYLPPYSPDLNPIELVWSKSNTGLAQSASPHQRGTLSGDRRGLTNDLTS